MSTLLLPLCMFMIMSSQIFALLSFNGCMVEEVRHAKNISALHKF